MKDNPDGGAADVVLGHLQKVADRGTRFVRIGMVIGLVAGLISGCLLVFALGMNDRWIGLGMFGLILGGFLGRFGGVIRHRDLENIRPDVVARRGAPHRDHDGSEPPPGN